MYNVYSSRQLITNDGFPESFYETIIKPETNYKK